METFLYILVGLSLIFSMIAILKLWCLLYNLSSTINDILRQIIDIKICHKAYEKKLENLEKCYENLICKLESKPEPHLLKNTYAEAGSVIDRWTRGMERDEEEALTKGAIDKIQVHYYPAKKR